MIQAIDEIRNEYRNILHKNIHKQKQKNQYTSDFQIKYLEQKQEKRIKKEIIVLQSQIPKQLGNRITFRLNSNVQLPKNANSAFQLGCLNIDLYCYNYRPIRIDKNDQITTITLEPIQRDYTTFEQVNELLIQQSQNLSDSFSKLHHQKLDQSKYNIITKQQAIEFHNSITKPLTGYISKIQNGQIITQMRIINNSYLTLLGINEDMLYHHIMETGFMPLPFFFDENASSSQQYLSKFFELNINSSQQREMTAINYEGQEFQVKITHKNYYVYNQEENIYYEYLMFIWDCDRKWLSKKKVLDNYIHYFNLDNFNSALTLPDIKSEISLRCGVKSIVQ